MPDTHPRGFFKDIGHWIKKHPLAAAVIGVVVGVLVYLVITQSQAQTGNATQSDILYTDGGSNVSGSGVGAPPTATPSSTPPSTPGNPPVSVMPPTKPGKPKPIKAKPIKKKAALVYHAPAVHGYDPVAIRHGTKVSTASQPRKISKSTAPISRPH